MKLPTYPFDPTTEKNQSILKALKIADKNSTALWFTSTSNIYFLNFNNPTPHFFELAHTDAKICLVERPGTEFKFSIFNDSVFVDIPFTQSTTIELKQNLIYFHTPQCSSTPPTGNYTQLQGIFAIQLSSTTPQQLLEISNLFRFIATNITNKRLLLALKEQVFNPPPPIAEIPVTIVKATPDVKKGKEKATKINKPLIGSSQNTVLPSRTPSTALNSTSTSSNNMIDTHTQEGSWNSSLNIIGTQIESLLSQLNTCTAQPDQELMSHLVSSLSSQYKAIVALTLRNPSQALNSIPLQQPSTMMAVPMSSYIQHSTNLMMPMSPIQPPRQQLVNQPPPQLLQSTSEHITTITDFINHTGLSVVLEGILSGILKGKGDEPVTDLFPEQFLTHPNTTYLSSFNSFISQLSIVFPSTIDVLPSHIINMSYIIDFNTYISSILSTHTTSTSTDSNSITSNGKLNKQDIDVSNIDSTQFVDKLLAALTTLFTAVDVGLLHGDFYVSAAQSVVEFTQN